MTVEISVRPIHIVTDEEIRLLKKYSYKSEGWLCRSVDLIRRGHRSKALNGRGYIDVPLVYDRGHILVASEDGDLLGWGLVRHPLREVEYTSRVWPECDHEFYTDCLDSCNTYTEDLKYAGLLPDIMLYCKSTARRQRVGRKLITVAYNNFGKMICFPHDKSSEKFFGKFDGFLELRNTKWIDLYDLEALEIYY